MQGNSMIPTDRKFDERVLTRICQECGDVLDGLDNAGTVYDGGGNVSNNKTGAGSIIVPTL